MATRSLQDQVSDLLFRRVAEAKTRGTPNTPVEATAVFESIALNLLLKPRSALYVALLARNRMLQVVTDELAAIAALVKSINDLGNTSFLIRDTTKLQDARIALLQIEGLSRVDSSSGAFLRFSSSVQAFLDQSLSKSVRTPGQSELTRPSDEAAADLPGEFQTLIDLHSDLLDRLYALRVGIQNFLTSPIGTVLGLVTATRARLDIEDIIDQIDSDPSAQNARDMAIRLIANRASVRVVGNQPSPFDPVLDTVSKLPQGYALRGRSDDASATATSAVAPFILPVAAQLQVTVGSVILTKNFPQNTADLQNKAHIIGNVVSFPVVVPDQYYVFLSVVDGFGVETQFKIPINISGGPLSLTKAQILTALNAGLGGFGIAIEFADVGTDRILIYSTYASIKVNSVFTETVLGVVTAYTNSAHSLLGFELAQEGIAGSTPLSTVVDAWNFFFSSLVAAVKNQTTFTVVGVSTDPTVAFAVGGTGASALGLAGTFLASVSTLTLQGTTPASPQSSEVSPVGLLQVGDLLTTPTGSSTVRKVSSVGIELQTSLPGFDGNISITSAVVSSYSALVDELVPFIDEDWLKSNFSTGLFKLDSAVAALVASPTPARRNAALSILSDLSSKLSSLIGILSDSSTFLPVGSGQEERQIVSGILVTLQERKFDRAEDLLLRCKIQELSSLTVDSASFGGNFIQSMSDFARSDVNFPNKSKDEGLTAKAVKVRIGRDT